MDNQLSTVAQWLDMAAPGLLHGTMTDPKPIDSKAGGGSESKTASAGADVVAVARKNKEADKITLEPLPSVPKLRLWRSAFRKEVAGASIDPDGAFEWI
eukprot:7788051-Karenia_brevis.AAC.1